MTEEREIVIEGTVYKIVISDEKEALLAAKAVGRALIGLWNGDSGDLWPASYVVEHKEDLDSRYLEQVVRRTYGMPWKIGETERLLIREFQEVDARKVPREETDTEEDRIFYTPEQLSQYIRCQYGFYEYGLWALEDKKTGELVGKAGITYGSYGERPWKSQRKRSWESQWERPRESQGEKSCGNWRETFLENEAMLYLEMGYHVFSSYRHRGYAREACRKIVELVTQAAQSPCCIYAKIDASNKASIRVAESCGLSLRAQKYTEEGRWLCLYSGCWR